MSRFPGLDKEDSDLLGFVVACLFCSAISREEFHQWCQSLIQSRNIESIPDYFFELESLAEPLTHLYRVIGFVPSWRHSDDERDALWGITAMRGRDPFDWAVPRDAALEKLARHPGIATRFRETFPFIPIQ